MIWGCIIIWDGWVWLGVLIVIIFGFSVIGFFFCIKWIFGWGILCGVLGIGCIVSWCFCLILNFEFGEFVFCFIFKIFLWGDFIGLCLIFIIWVGLGFIFWLEFWFSGLLCVDRMIGLWLVVLKLVLFVEFIILFIFGKFCLLFIIIWFGVDERIFAILILLSCFDIDGDGEFWEFVIVCGWEVIFIWFIGIGEFLLILFVFIDKLFFLLEFMFDIIEFNFSNWDLDVLRWDIFELFNVILFWIVIFFEVDVGKLFINIVEVYVIGVLVLLIWLLFIEVLEIECVVFLCVVEVSCDFKELIKVLIVFLLIFVDKILLREFVVVILFYSII